jgi:hypothetical protein
VRLKPMHRRMPMNEEPLPEIVPVMVIRDGVLKRIVLRLDVRDPSTSWRAM